jgi:hypothetical protein
MRDPSWVDYLGFGMMLAIAIFGMSVLAEAVLK